jgi:hypothetical protein
MRSEVRTKGGQLKGVLSVTETDVLGRYRFRSTDTSDWFDNGHILHTDIWIYDVDKDIPTETFGLEVIPAITRKAESL